MGGDFGVPATIEGALHAKKETPYEIILVGDEAIIHRELKHHNAAGAFPVVHAATVVGMHEKPAEACRSKRDSSIMVCAQLVKEGRADALFSAGNSGATMAAALLQLGRIKGVARPAIATIMPTLSGSTVLLDMGANVDCKPRHLLQFAIMGSIYAQSVLNVDHPTVGMLTIGEEEGKGNELTQETHPLLKESGLNYIGHVEGRDIPRGVVDVIVCDGFVGNVVLKFAEGLAAAIIMLIKDEMRKHPLAVVGKLLFRRAFRNIRKKTDPSEYGGAPLLGVDGAVFIGHGHSNAVSVKNAVRTAGNFVEKGINRQISEQLERINGLAAEAAS
jgi:phosphate acyltransferase